MKITEIVLEAHHYVHKTIQIGSWTVHLDSHAIVSAAHRNVPFEVLTNIISYLCFMPDVLPTFPVGRGAYFQDTNTLVSIFVKRISENDVRIETVLGSDMKPKPPLFRRPVPANTKSAPANLKQIEKHLHKASQEQGRDAVSQDIESGAHFAKNLNREQRRRLEKIQRRSK